MSDVRWNRTWIPLAVMATLLLTAACGATVANESVSNPNTSKPSTAGPAAAAKPAPLNSPSPSLCPKQTPAYNATNFPQVPRIDNKWFPLVPGTRFVLEGRADRNNGPLPHRVVFTVTDLVKVIDGVSNIVVFDTDIQDGEIAESELAFFAQDLDGNVWNLGEYPEEYEDGKFAGAPSTWFSGSGDAHGGIHMKADAPAASDWYLQGSVPSIEFLDCARVSQTDAKACVPVRCFDGVLVTDETSPLEKGSGIQKKYHAAGVGIVQVGAVGSKEGETLQLIEHRRATAKERAAARTAALALETHAYQSNAMYKRTAAAR